MSREFHLSDQDLLMAADGELPRREAMRVESHLATCWECRARRQEIEAAIAEFIRFQRSGFGDKIPAPDGPRALLKAQMNRLAEARGTRAGFLHLLSRSLTWAAVLAVLFVCALAPAVWRQIVRQREAQLESLTVPNRALTPGATILFSQPDVCREASPKNKIVPAALRRKVFAEYGIRGAQPGAYEIDYLITPALGGADDIHNLWPESSRAALWNAQVKDTLEDRLREMVCGGQLDLQVAQRELASNWIEAYKKYFHTDRPIADTR